MGTDGKYRPDIDGLRAVAVGLVIFYHLRPAALPSGFLGVDIFFVISGYVVAKSALPKVTGKPFADIWAFWLRRIRRIVPPLILAVVGGALAAAAVFPPFPPINYETIFRTGAASLFGLSNLYLERTATDYFLLDTAQLNPFLHTWSLGIEEQYYVAFAMLAIGLPALLRLNRARRPYLFALVIISVMVPAVAAVTSGMSSLEKFYLPQTRVWEIGLGGLIAISPRLGFNSPGWRKAAYLVRLAALLGLFVFAAFPHDQGAYPTVSVFGACLLAGVIVGLPSTLEGGRDPLELAPVVYLGKISYGLYLWHWIVLFVLQATIGTATVVAVLLAVAVPLVLSSASYRFVERPFRDQRRMSDGRVLVSAGAGLAIALGVLAVVHESPGRFYAGKTQNWSGDWLPPPVHSYTSDGKITKQLCHLGGGAPEVVPAECIARHSGDRAGPTLLVVGDSHAFSDWTMAATAYGRGWDLAALSMDGCPLSLGPPDCIAYWQRVQGYAGALLGPDDVLYVSVNWAGSRSDQDYSVLAALAAVTAKRGARLVVKGPLPKIGRASFLCIKEVFRTDYKGCAVARDDELSRIGPRRIGLTKFAEGHSHVEIFDPFDALCPGQRCEAFRGGKPLFRDSNHLSAWGSATLAADFNDLLGPPPTRAK